MFNASSKTTTGISLNEAQMIGEKLQLDLFFITINFRKYKYGITADIEKMYRQILVHRDRKYQKILWRFKETDPVGVYELNTVTYGQTCAPHRAIRALVQCTIDNEHCSPLGASIIKNCFYVDDLITGDDSVNGVHNIKEGVAQVLKQGGFNITKWKGNEKTKDKIELKDPEMKSVLGLFWDTQRDKFFFKF